MNAVLVTGGAGYVGSHCCKALAEAGFEPVAYDDLSMGHASAVRWGPLIEGDVRDRDALASALRRTRAQAVLHFAARSLVGRSVEDPGSYWDVNVAGTLRLLEAMREVGLDRLVFSSSCAIYGTPDARAHLGGRRTAARQPLRDDEDARAKR